jgi:hypothetical protein
LLAAWAGWALCRFEVEERGRDLVAAALAMGLGLAHHVTMIYLVAAALLYVAARRHEVLWHWAAEIVVRAVRLRRPAFAAGARFASWPIAPLAAIALAAPLIFYAYLLWATAHTTAIAWGAPSDWDTLHRHVTAKQYQRYLASAGFGAHLDRIRALPSLLFAELLPAGAFFAAAGAIALARRAWRPALLLAVFLALNLAHGCYYAVTDYEVYFVPALLPAAIFAGLGLSALLSRAPAGTVLGGVAVAAQLVLGAAKAADLGRDELVTEAYGAEVAEHAPRGAVLLTQGDWFVGTLWYENHVLGRGLDVATLDVGNLWTWWHQQYLASRYPAACDPLAPAFRDDPAAYAARCGTYAKRVALAARDPWVSLGLDPPPPGAVLELGPPWSDRIVRGGDPRCAEYGFRSEHTVTECGCFGYAERKGKLAERCIHAAEEGGVVPRPPLEMFVQRVIEDHIDERPVLERNALTHKKSPESGPTFHRVSGDFALVNRGLYNQILHAADVAADTCAPAALRRIAPRPLEPARPRPRPPDRRRAYQPNEVPTLIASTFLAPSSGANEGDATRTFRAGDPVYLHFDWLERVPHGVRVCVFDPEGRKVATRTARAGKTGALLLLATTDRTPRGTYTIEACSTGPGAGAAAPCGRAILEYELTVR